MLDELNVEPCPVCGDNHRYRLQIIRDFIGRGRGDEKSKPDYEIFERILICPKLDRPFKYTIEVPRQRPLFVKSISVEYVEDDE